MLAVIDSNVWISALLTPKGFSARIVEFLRAGAFRIAYGDALLMELKDSALRPRLVSHFGLTLEDVNELVALLTFGGAEFEPRDLVRICRDPDDDIFIALAVAAKADYLVTRDDDLKGDGAVREYLAGFGVQLVTVREFVEVLEAAAGQT